MQLISTQPNLNKAVPSSRVRICRLSFPVLVLGLCALTCLVQRAALGQAQVGSAETSFDEGPDKLPAIPNTPIPSLRTEIPAQIAQSIQPPHQPVRVRLVSAHVEKPSPVLAQDFRARNNLTLRKKLPEGTLTAAR
jgi:hypothetical protein